MCRSASVSEHVTGVWRSVLCLKGLRCVCVFVVFVCVCVYVCTPTYACFSHGEACQPGDV